VVSGPTVAKTVNVTKVFLLGLFYVINVILFFHLDYLCLKAL